MFDHQLTSIKHSVKIVPRFLLGFAYELVHLPGSIHRNEMNEGSNSAQEREMLRK